MKKKVYIISHYAEAPAYGKFSLNHWEKARKFIEHGYDVKVFASSFVHNTDINFINDGKTYIEKDEDGVPFVYVKTRSYKNSRVKRVFNMIDFAVNTYKAMQKIGRADMVIVSMPHPLACLSGMIWANKHKIPFICEVLDLWPESIVTYAGYSRENVLIKLLYKFEKYLYKKASGLIFSWEGGYDYIIDKKWDKDIPNDKFHYVNIGVDIEKFNKDLSENNFTDKDLDDADTFKIVYCGAIRQANDIGTLVDSAKEIQNRGLADKIKFIIYGDGNERKTLEERCKNEHINNVTFKGFVAKNRVPCILTRSDVNVLNLKESSTQKYGNSSNKLFEYFAAGNPVVTNIDEGKYPIVSKYNCGIVLKDRGASAYADAIEHLYHCSKEELAEYQTKAKLAANEFDTDKLNEEYVNIVAGYMG